jgi:hypothetical protein
MAKTREGKSIQHAIPKRILEEAQTIVSDAVAAGP